ncbi:MAG: shikimate kinase [Planctomycetota bacterium]
MREMTETAIYLIGYRGTGKTSVGRVLADRMARRCIDLDREIETASGQSICAIFERGGEASFRDWESRCLVEVANQTDPCVIALGGGAILRQTNRDLIKSTGVCVWLTADVTTLAARIRADSGSTETRPALTDLAFEDEIAAVLADREPLYRQSADHVVATQNRSPPQIAQHILDWYGQGRFSKDASHTPDENPG